MSQVITPGSMSESDALILSARHVREQAGLPCDGGTVNERILASHPRVELSYANCVKHAEIHLSPSEKRGRHLAAIAREAETTDIKTMRKPLIERETWIAMGFCALGGIALMLVYLEVPFRLGQLFGSLR